jgi:hypothetical protein
MQKQSPIPFDEGQAPPYQAADVAEESRDGVGNFPVSAAGGLGSATEQLDPLPKMGSGADQHLSVAASNSLCRSSERAGRGCVAFLSSQAKMHARFSGNTNFS